MKKQLKKSFSLFLAVLMLMSCWVWVAPEKAAAAGPSYTLEIIQTGSGKGGHINVYYYPWNDDGTLSSTETKYSGKEFESVFNDAKTFSATIPGFPVRLELNMNADGSSIFNGTISAKIGGVQVLTGKNLTGTKSETRVINAVYNGTRETSTIGSVNWSLPAVNTVTSIDAIDVGTLNKLPNGASIQKTSSITGVKDRYGATLDISKYAPTSGVTYTIKDGSGNTVGSEYATVSGTGKTATVTVKAAAQKYTGVAGNAKGDFYLYAKYNNQEDAASAKINFDNPPYTITFDANGGKIGADDSESSDKVTVGGEDSKMYYDTAIGKAPAYRTKAGKTFMGFYSEKNADATGATTNFSGTKFEDDVTKVDASGDKTWYAAWQSTPIDVTFVTADNQLIGTIKGRYDNYLTNTNMYGSLSALNAEVKGSHTGGKVKFNSNNEPIYTDGSSTYTFAGWKIIKAYDDSVIDGDVTTILQGNVTYQAVYTKAGAATYTVKFKDAAGTVISTKSGYKYRDDVTNIPTTEPTKAQDDKYNYEFIGWAKDIGKNFYTVDETDKNEDGATIVYTAKDGAEFVVKGDASYVPVFRMIPREYTVTYNYTEDNNTPASTSIEGYHWADGVKMPEIKDNYTAGGYRYYLTGWKVNNEGSVKQLDEISVQGDMNITAVYGNAEAAKYTINFYGKAEDGVTDVLLNEDSNIYEHNSTVTPPEVAQEIDTAKSLYTFAGWSPEINTTASGDAEYHAIYTKKDYADIHFYNYDGELIYELDGKENGLFVDELIPEYLNKDEEGNDVLPVKPEDKKGTYNFKGWADSDGNVVVPGTDKFTGDTFLYAQFDTVYKEYTITFLNDVLDEAGKEVVVSTDKYHYGDEIEVPDDPEKESDVEYIYDFKAWSPEVSEICYDNATYTATYRRTPQYYKVTWLNDAKAVHTESNYQYNAKIQQAIINAPVAYEPAETGKTWVLKHWVQCDANGDDILVDGKQVLFVRGQRMGSEQLYFYPVFEQEANVLTVTFYKEDGTSRIGEARVPYGTNIGDVAEPFAAKAPKLSDDDYHYVIEKWVNVDDGTEVATITADVSVKATYTAEAHSKEIYEVVAEPTCNVPGYAHYKCDVTECTDIDYNVAIAPIADEGKPTGQFYVGANKWTLDDYATIDYSDIKYVGPSTFVIVNAEDTGTRSMPWNLEGKLNRGVGKIEYYVSESEVDDPSKLKGWTTIYDYEEFRTEALNTVLKENNLTRLDYDSYIRGTVEQKMLKAEIDRTVDAMLSGYYANASAYLSNLNLVNGKTYIIYIKISDREGLGEVNVSYLSSGTIKYGTTPAVITVTGEGSNTKFCEKANIRITDDEDALKVYLDGEEVSTYTNPGTTSANGTFVATFETTEAGLHTVTVVDRNGNKTTKTFEIKGNHSFRKYTIAASCENAGSEYDLCTICGAKANEASLPAIGHSYSVNFVDKAADCINDGYRTYICDNNCGTKLVLKPTDDDATLAQAQKYVEPEEGEEEGKLESLKADDLKHLKATGEHTYAKVKDENGEDTEEDAWITDKEPTCSAVGSKHRDCTVCGITGRETAVIPLDTVNGHKFYRAKVVSEPLCQEIGKKTKTCRYCGYEETTEYIDALGHVAGEYVILQAPTCTASGKAMLTCSVCDCYIGEGEYDPMKEPVAKILAPLGHAWKVDGGVYSEDITDGTGETITVWYQNYKCSTCDEIDKRKLDGYKPPVAATVTFDFNGGYFEIPAVGSPNEFGYVPPMLKGTQTIKTTVGESIIAPQVEDAFKLSDATYRYTFSHWEDTEGNEVKFPIEVKGNATYYAVYTEKYINYTATYYREDGTEYKKVGYLHNGDQLKDLAAPKKDGYKFIGWALSTNGEAQDVITVKGSDISLFAKYEKLPVYYVVEYAYSDAEEDVIARVPVLEGTVAPECGLIPEKAADEFGHYEFTGWDKASELLEVNKNIEARPEFSSKDHNYKIEKTQEATCLVPVITKYTCEVCGYSYDVVGETLEHIWSEFSVDAAGNKIFTCQRGCGATKTENAPTYTIKFYDADNTTVYFEATGVAKDALLADYILANGPAKEEDAEYTYEFIGWTLKDGTDVLPEKVTEDIELVPVYKETKRTYTVIFAYDGLNIIEKVEVKAGDKLDKIPTAEKAYDEYYHYTFNGWSKAEELAEKIYSNIYTTAEFTAVEHATAVTGVKSEATCTANRVDTYECSGCDYTYDKEATGSVLGHDWEESNGTKVCSLCGVTSSGSEASYTITYYDVTGKVYRNNYNIVPGTVLGTVILKDGPAKAADKEYTYEFKGWKLKNSEAALPETVTVNLELVPDYNRTKRFYTVTYAINANNILAEVKVEAGKAPDTVPDISKDSDDKYHYTSKWNKESELAAVYSDIYTTPVYTAVAHNFNVTSTPATCTANRIDTYTCACGYSDPREIANTALGHNLVENTDEDGNLVKECSRCDYSTTEGITLTVTYYADKAGKSVFTYKRRVKYNTSFSEIKPAGTPSQVQDASNDYEFSGWATKNSQNELVEIADTEKVTTNLKLYPNFTPKKRTYKVTFSYMLDGKSVVTTVSVKAGESVTAPAVVPEKAPDSKNHYTFKGWNRADELGKVYRDIYTTAEFTPYKHSFTEKVIGATCTANKKIEYTCTCGYKYTSDIPNTMLEHAWDKGVDNGEGKVIYTCTDCPATKDETATYKVEYRVDGKVVDTVTDVVYGTKLADLLKKEVTKAADKTYTYEFKGWLLDNAAPVADATVTGNVVLDAEFTSTIRKYRVTFAYGPDDVIKSIVVDAGTILDPEVIPTAEQAFDDQYHYTFVGWNKATALSEAIYSDIFTKPEFLPDAHHYDEDVTPATCFVDEKITYTCDCGKSYEEYVAGTKGHKWVETTDDVGNIIKKCTACGETTTEGLKFTITYYVDNKSIAAKKNVEYGTKLADILSTLKPNKEKDERYIYTFNSWKINGKTEIGDTLVTRDIALHATYDTEFRLYSVVFGYDAKNVIQTIDNVKYDDIRKTTELYDKAEYGEPTKAWDLNCHYIYSGWKEPNIKEDSCIYYAEFEAVKHSKYVDNDDPRSKEATCVHGPCIVTKCTGCDFYDLDETGSALPHEYELVSEKLADNGKDVIKTYKCKNCDASYEDVIKWEDPEANYVTITVVVKESGNGNAPVKGAKVDLYSGNTWIQTEYTSENGIAKFKVAKGKYRAIVSGVQGAGTTEFNFDAKDNGQTVESPKISIKHCGCACHNTSIWGKIFRFFHKIIQKITGEFKCCADPSHLYYS